MAGFPSVPLHTLNDVTANPQPRGTLAPHAATKIAIIRGSLSPEARGFWWVLRDSNPRHSPCKGQKALLQIKRLRHFPFRFQWLRGRQRTHKGAKRQRIVPKMSQHLTRARTTPAHPPPRGFCFDLSFSLCMPGGLAVRLQAHGSRCVRSLLFFFWHVLSYIH